MKPPVLPVPLGTLLHGKYRLESVIGEGAMGVVISAYHVQLERRVALKFLTAEAAETPEASARFAREARAATRIQSEHVVRVLDVGEVGDAEHGTPYMVMEFLEGEDLSEVLRVSGPLSVSDAVDFILQACEALAEAHAAGIVHRDLKPANLFRTHRADGSGLVKVCDFGIAKSGLNDSAKLTFANAFVGSPVYSAPEQIRSASAVDARADIWALGVILFELLTGETPFNARSFPELAVRILSDDVPDIRALRPDVPVALARTIAACLERDVERRLPNVAVLARELAEILPPAARISADRIARVLDLAASSRGQVATLPSPVLPSAVDSPDPRSVSAGTGRQNPLGLARETSPPQALSVGIAQKRRSWVGWGAAALSLVALGAGGAFLWGAQGAPIPAPKASATEPSAASKELPRAASVRTVDAAIPAVPLEPKVSSSSTASAAPSAAPAPTTPAEEPPQGPRSAPKGKRRSSSLPPEVPAPPNVPPPAQPKVLAAPPNTPAAPPAPPAPRPSPKNTERNALDMDLK